MIYIEATLTNGSIVHNADFSKTTVIIETDDGDEIEFNLSDKLDIQLYTPLQIETTADFLKAVNNKNVFVNIEGEDAIFQTFPNDNLKSLINDDTFSFDEIHQLSYMPVGIKKGGVKEVSFKKLMELIDKGN